MAVGTKIKPWQWNKACAKRAAGHHKVQCIRKSRIPYAVFFRYLKFIEEQHELWSAGQIRKNKHVNRWELWLDAEYLHERGLVNDVRRNPRNALWLLKKNHDHYKDEEYKAADLVMLGIYLGRQLTTLEEIEEELGGGIAKQLRRRVGPNLLEGSFVSEEDTAAG